jgi:hypothetical protein
MHTFYHAQSSAKKWGGQPEDYMPVHEFLDQSKVAMADVRHRAMLHHTLGTRLAEQALGVTVTNSDGKEVPVRLIAERHIIEDLGFLATPQDWLKCVSLRAIPWAGGHAKTLKRKGVPISHSILERVEKQS